MGVLHDAASEWVYECVHDAASEWVYECVHDAASEWVYFMMQLVSGSTECVHDAASECVYECMQLVSVCMSVFMMQVSATYADGYRVIAVSPVIGPRVEEKCKKTAAAILDR